MKSLLQVELLSQDARKNKDRRRTSRWDTDLNIDFQDGCLHPGFVFGASPFFLKQIFPWRSD